ncbi:hypothetical protein [Corynebacterium meridianum]|uniref:Uncharacterized protein n=1 Tax=Corynebacterium meridianum TaxID=2765363 RepID=A0A934I7D4_9CORY|nr:hypothetical protein [Corynebacterium meridianum]MBI8988623.1 hypothetical protein [Corynebacterium meridianum]MCK7677093.1 hypothetical protein [Corynebacterium meridianum]
MTTPRGRHARSDDDAVSPAPVVRLNTESFRVPTGADFIAISQGAPAPSTWPPRRSSGNSAGTTASTQAGTEPAELFRRKVHSHRATVHDMPHRPVVPESVPEPDEQRTADPAPDPVRPRPANHRQEPPGHRRWSRPGAAFFSIWSLPSGTEPHLLRPTAQRQLTYWVVATFLCCVGLGIGLALLIHGLSDGLRASVNSGCLLSTVALCLFFGTNAFLRPGDVLR